jgi:hypothetical protein
VNSEAYITASSAICKQTVYKNGKQVFESKGTVLSDFLNAAYLHFNLQYPRFYKMDNLSKLGLLGVEIMLGGEPARYAAEEKGIVLANASASLDTDLKYYETVNGIPSPALFVYTLPNIMIGEICIKYNFKGENAFFVLKQFDATFMEQYIGNLFSNQLLKACIGGWAELLEEEHWLVLFFVEKEKRGQSLPFTVENIRNVFNRGNT